jgi:hypothetical protein
VLVICSSVWPSKTGAQSLINQGLPGSKTGQPLFNAAGDRSG